MPPSKTLLNDTGDVIAPHFFVGDKAFPLRSDLLRPFSRNALTNDAKIFNYRLSHAGRVVENFWGILANHWRLYHRHIYLNPKNVTTVIKATLVLHNILTLPNDNIQNEKVEDHVQVFDVAFEDFTKQGKMPATATAHVCTCFTGYFCSICRAGDWKMKLYMLFKN